MLKEYRLEIKGDNLPIKSVDASIKKDIAKSKKFIRKLNTKDPFKKYK